jgi:hypothetical protein
MRQRISASYSGDAKLAEKDFTISYQTLPDVTYLQRKAASYVNGLAWKL